MKKLPGYIAKPRFRAAIDADSTLEMLVYGDIIDAATMSMLQDWQVSTDAFTSALKVKMALDSGDYSRIRVRIDSEGGDAFEGLAIHSLLSSQSKPVDVFVDGIAASAASLLAMAGATRTMGKGSMMMIHRAATNCSGNSADMLQTAAILDKIDESIGSVYADRTGIDLATIRAMMRDSTWMSADDCVSMGFATPSAMTPASAMRAARAQAALAMRKRSARAAAADGCPCDCESCVNGDCSECSNADCDSPDCINCPMQGTDNNLSLYVSRLRLFEGTAPDRADDNLSLYEARLAMARARF